MKMTSSTYEEFLQKFVDFANFKLVKAKKPHNNYVDIADEKMKSAKCGINAKVTKEDLFVNLLFDKVDGLALYNKIESESKADVENCMSGFGEVIWVSKEGNHPYIQVRKPVSDFAEETDAYSWYKEVVLKLYEVFCNQGKMKECGVDATAEKAKAEAEKMKAEAEKAKLEAEKVAAEKAKAEAEKMKAEAEKKAVEKAKAEAEKAKLEAEKAALEKLKAETEKAKAELAAAEKMKAELEKAKAEAEKAKAAAEKAQAEASNAQLDDVKAVTTGRIKDGHTYVDLGLPSRLKWATCNIGAEYEDDWGNYFQFGDIKVEKTFGVSSRSDISHNLKLDEDAASNLWQGGWRMPSKGEMSELIANCDWEWTDDYKRTGCPGIIGTSKKNGNKIFFPASGYKDSDVAAHFRGQIGYYRTTEYLYSGGSYYCYIFTFSSQGKK